MRKITQRYVVKAQHRPIDLQRPVVDGKLQYQSVCWCGRKAVIGTRCVTEKDQKAHRREMLIGVR